MAFGDQVMLGAGSSPIDGREARRRPPQRSHVRAVRHGDLQVQPIQGTQLVEQQLVDLGEHAGFGPVPQSAPAGHPGATGHLAG